MRVALLMTDAWWYAGTGYAEAWTAALTAEGCAVERVTGLPPAWLRDGPPAYDLAVAHVLTEEVAVFGPLLQAAAVLEAAGVPLLNSTGSLLVSSDKLATAAVWAAAGVPQPATHDLAALSSWPLPGQRMVLKPSLGDGARNVVLVGSLEEAARVVEAWRDDPHARGAAVLQEWVAEPVCLRLFATPSDCSPAYEKGRPAGSVVTAGTVYTRVAPPTPQVAALARRMVATLGGGLMGVDVLVGADGRPLALEANGPFGFDVTDPEQGRWVARAARARALVG